MKTCTRFVTAVAIAATLVAPSPAGAANERMELHCDDGTLQGHTLERTNGSSWWDVGDGTVYTTRSLTISDDQGVVYQHDYGKKSRSAETCTGDHFDWTWDLEVVEAGS